VGNVLGSAVNWVPYCGIERHRDSYWFRLKPDALGHAQAWHQLRSK
jgi:membrane protein YqaA with SNARE-associated domain